jgi:hypothetical protein
MNEFTDPINNLRLRTIKNIMFSRCAVLDDKMWLVYSDYIYDWLTETMDNRIWGPLWFKMRTYTWR